MPRSPLSIRPGALLCWLLLACSAFTVRVASANACNFTLEFQTTSCERVTFSFHQNNESGERFGEVKQSSNIHGVLGVGTHLVAGYAAVGTAFAEFGRLHIFGTADRSGLPVTFPPESGVTSAGIQVQSVATLGDFITLKGNGQPGSTARVRVRIDVDGFLEGNPLAFNPEVDVNLLFNIQSPGCVGIACTQHLVDTSSLLNPNTGEFHLVREFDGLTAGDRAVFVIQLLGRTSVNSVNLPLRTGFDVSNTLHFYFDVLTPGFTAEANSGHDYAFSPVPVPGCALGFGGMVLALLRRVRR